ncbi:helix-turn-helix transcriptional regulator [Desulfoscipio gibsoniae]
MDSPVDLWVKDPVVKWNLTITTDPYPTLSFTSHETMTLLWLFAEFPPPGELGLLQKKLKDKLFPKDKITAAEEVSKRFHTRGGFVLQETDYLDKLCSAVLDELKVELKYYTGNGQEVIWFLRPYGLIFHTGNASWYLVAEKEETREIAACHLGRIRGVKVLDEQFDYPEDFSIKHYLRKRWGMDMSRSEMVRVRFYNEANVIEKVQREFRSRGLVEAQKTGGRVAGIPWQNQRYS